MGYIHYAEAVMHRFRRWLEKLESILAMSEIVGWASGLFPRLKAHFRQPQNRVMWGILILATVLRCIYLDMIPFGVPEIRYLRQGLAIVEQRRLPLASQGSASAIAEPAMAAYLLAIPLAISRDPRVVALFVASLNVLAVFGLYALARRYYGVQVAIIAATLFAVNPWSVVFARQIGPFGLLPPFGVLLLYGLCTSLLKNNPWGWALTAASLGIMSSINLTSLVLAPVVIVILAIYYRRVRWLHLLLGICLAIIILLPYLYYENANRFADLRSLGRLFTSANKARAWDALRASAWLHSGGHLASLTGVSADQFQPDGSPLGWLDILAMLLYLFSLPAMGIQAFRAWGHWKESQDPAKFVVPVLWLCLPLALAMLVGKTDLDYTLALWPTGFLSMGLLAEWLLALPNTLRRLKRLWWSPYLQFGGWLALLLIVTWQAYTLVYLDSFLMRHDTSGGTYSVPLRFWRRTANLVRREVQAANADQVWILTLGSDPAQDEYPSALDYLLKPDLKTVFLRRNKEESLLLPAARPGVYLITHPSPQAEGALWRLRAEEKGVVIFPGRHEARVQVADARPPEQLLDAIQQRGFWALDSGLRLLGYDGPTDARAGQRITLSTYWTFQHIPPQERAFRHKLFCQLLDQDGTKVAQWQGLGLAEPYWEEGLLLVQWVDLLLPASLQKGEYDLVAGMYRVDESYRNRSIDEKGRDLGDTLYLGTIRIGE